VPDLLLIGLAGVASVGIIGTLLVAARRRRAPERVPAMPAPPFADDEILRRLARSDRGQPFHDPIVAALGVDEEMAARRAIRRAGGPNRGGEEMERDGRPDKR